jgi:hypothetical protein
MNEKNIILIAIGLLFISSKIWDIVWDIGKSIMYLIGSVYILNYLNPSLANKYRQFINHVITFNNNSTPAIKPD